MASAKRKIVNESIHLSGNKQTLISLVRSNIVLSLVKKTHFVTFYEQVGFTARNVSPLSKKNVRIGANIVSTFWSLGKRIFLNSNCARNEKNTRPAAKIRRAIINHLNETSSDIAFYHSLFRACVYLGRCPFI